jgi:proteasome accessory factor A
VSRSVPFTSLVSGLLPFLVSRQIIAGAGKAGIEAQEGRTIPGRYQISQRADFMETELSVDTMHNRPLLNTRDEPHADRHKYRRLHLIIGDANMCEYATALKVGTTRLVLDLIERGEAPRLELSRPVEAVKQLSRDPDLKTQVCLTDGRAMSGLELQEVYYDAAQQSLAGADDETDWTLREWHDTLAWLARDRSRLVGKLDWVTKLWLLESFAQEERIGWDDPWLASLDLEYHNVDPERGLFLGLEQEGKTTRLVSDVEIQRAIKDGPADTRGGIRGLCVQRFPDQIKAVQWERIQFRNGLFSAVLDLGDLFDPQSVQSLRRMIETADSPADLLEQWEQRQAKG